MHLFTILITFISFCSFAQVNLETLLPNKNCLEMRGLDLSTIVGATTKITSVESIVDGQNRAQYCDIIGVISPAIKFEVKLPQKGWSQRFIQVGCGGLCGRLALRGLQNIETCAPALKGEIALATTDMGHSSQDGTWGNDDQLREDFAHRSLHLTSVVAKALISNFYGKGAKYSYFYGCSDGGREALIEAQRYPLDFDGIIAGAPAMNFTTQNTFYHGWNAAINLDDTGKVILTADKMDIVKKEVFKQCDGSDGLIDQIISTPWTCVFDYKKLLCQKSETECLTAKELAVVKNIYQGAHDSKGNKFVIHGPLLGSETMWSRAIIPSKGNLPQGIRYSLPVMKYLVYDKPKDDDFSIKDFKFTKSNFNEISKVHSLYDSTNIHINKFVKNGGKLLLWHGLADTDISPYNTIAYYEGIQKSLGIKTVENMARLYLLPGVGHCGGGEAPNSVELLTAMMNWVESDHAPEMLMASYVKKSGPPIGSYNGSATRKVIGNIVNTSWTRPIYPYPYTSKYTGKGDIKDGNNFIKGKSKPLPIETTYWLGSRYFK